MASLRPPAGARLCVAWAVTFLFSFALLIAASSDERSITTLTAHELKALVSLVDPVKNLDSKDPNSYLSRILIPRPAGSANNTLVRKYIVDTLRSLKWHVEEEDTFTASTPYGEKPFTNIVATWNPDAPKRLVMSAHFDSKYYPKLPQSQFVGATDSAAPCAMLLDLAQALAPLLEARTKRLQGSDSDDAEEELDRTVQLVFFDGEEAFKEWAGTDNTYGARHLAEKWAGTYLLPEQLSSRRLHPTSTLLSTIEHLVLLDLLGAPDPLIKSYFPTTGWLFDRLVSAESRLGDAKTFDEGIKHPWKKWESFFMARTSYHVPMGYIGDDHEPFLHRGVPVLHIIPEPFPRVWHTLKDDASALDMPTMRRWALIFRVFVTEYMGMKPDIPTSKRSEHEELL